MSDDRTGGTQRLDRAGGTKFRAFRVRVTRGPDQGASAVVDRRGILVGRAAGAGLRLTDPAVSLFHCELAARAEGLAVRDLTSENGTFFAGARVSGAVVQPDSVLELGSSAVEVALEAGLAPPEDERASFGPLRCASGVMRTVFARLARLAPTELSVLLEGPEGTGKELAARAIHEASGRAAGAFVVVDCSSVPPGLAESVLFGQGQAEPASEGALESAGAGTLLLKEPGSLDAPLQAALLRALETRQVRSVGAASAHPIRARVLCSTRRDLREKVNAGRFSEQLYLRLAQARVVVPPLADRPEDVAPLADLFLKTLPPAVEGARAIAPDALEELARREYRANVRDLRSVVERASLVARGPTITTSDLAFERLLAAERERSTGADLAEIEPFKEAKRTVLDDFERDYLKALLLRVGDNLSRASAISGIERHHLRNLFRKHGLWDR